MQPAKRRGSQGHIINYVRMLICYVIELFDLLCLSAIPPALVLSVFPVCGRAYVVKLYQYHIWEEGGVGIPLKRTLYGWRLDGIFNKFKALLTLLPIHYNSNNNNNNNNNQIIIIIIIIIIITIISFFVIKIFHSEQRDIARRQNSGY